MSVVLAAIVSLFWFGEDPSSTVCSDAARAKCCAARCSAQSDSTAPAATPQQVQLRVLIADVDCGMLKDFGRQSVPAHTRDDDSADDTVEPDGKTPCPSGRAITCENDFAFGVIRNDSVVRECVSSLKEQGLAKVHFDTTLTGYSGRPCSLQSGGEFPIPVPDQQGKVTFEFRDYGAKLDYVPIVLGNGRIRLELRPEISELDQSNGVQVAGLFVPAIKTRRVDASVELKAGEACLVRGIYTAAASPPGQKAPCAECPLCNRNGEAKEREKDREFVVPVTAAAGAAERELVILVSAESAPPLTSSESPSAAWRPAKHAKCCAATQAVTHAMIEIADPDCDQPHPSAAGTCRGGVCPYTCHDKDEGPVVRDIEIRVDEVDTGPLMLGLGVGSDSGLPGHIVLKGAAKPTPACSDAYCHAAASDEECDAPCCHHADAAARHCPAHCEDDDEDECDVLVCPEDIVAAHIHHVQQMIAARIQWESALLQAKAAAETALARQQAKHAEQMLEIRAEHLTELQKQKEAMWESERRAIEARHRQDIEHEHELAELRFKQLRDSYERHSAAMDSEIRTLRERLGSSATERPHAQPTVATRPASKSEQPVVLEDRLEQVEYSTPSAHAGRAHPSEVDRLRREVARLRSLVEDLLCIAPDAPPAPVPQKPYEESSE